MSSACGYSTGAQEPEKHITHSVPSPDIKGLSRLPTLLRKPFCCLLLIPTLFCIHSAYAGFTYMSRGTPHMPRGTPHMPRAYSEVSDTCKEHPRRQEHCDKPRAILYDKGILTCQVHSHKQRAPSHTKGTLTF